MQAFENQEEARRGHRDYSDLLGYENDDKDFKNNPSVAASRVRSIWKQLDSLKAAAAASVAAEYRALPLFVLLHACPAPH